MTKPEPALGTVILSRLPAAGLVLLSLMALVAIGCAGKGTPASSQGPAGSAPAASQDAAPEQKADAAQAGGASSLSVEHVGSKTLVTFPVDSGVRVNPSYSFPKLSLSFSPSLTDRDYALPQEYELLESVAAEPGPGASTVSRLTLKLKQPVQFLISRPASDRVRVLLVPKQAADGSGRELSKEAATQRQGFSRLTDIDFTTDQEGTLFIKLFSGRPIKYYTDSKSNRKLDFVFPEMDIPPAYTKLYRLNRFEGPIQKALLQNTSKGGRMRLSMESRVPVNIDKTGNSLILAFKPEAPGQPAGSGGESPGSGAATQGANASAPNGGQAEPSMAAAQQGQGGEPLPDDPQTPLFPGMKEKYTGQPISIDLQDAEIEHVLRLISEVAGYNLILDENVSGTISLKLENVPWDQALDLVLLQKDLGMVKRGNILRIATAQQLEKEHQRVIEARKAALEAQKSRQELAPLTTEYIQVNYTKASQLQSQVEKFLSERGTVSQDPRTNQLIVSDTPTHIDKVKSVVRKLDRPERQVLIEARIVFATDQFQRGLGLRWGGGYETDDEDEDSVEQGGFFGTTADLDSPTGLDQSGFAVNLPNQALTTLGLGGYISKLTGTDLFTIDAQLDLGESKGQVKTISSPRIVTLNNQKAQMTQGRLLATQSESESGGTTTEYVEAVLDLSVTPQITPNNKLILDLDISDDSQAPGGGDDISTRTAKTKLIVDNGETVVIGGVQIIEENRSQRSVPGVSEVPFLGWLFKNKFRDQNKQELLIFIRPKIL